jgi:hypothetical protein
MLGQGQGGKEEERKRREKGKEKGETVGGRNWFMYSKYLLHWNSTTTFPFCKLSVGQGR